MFANIMEKKTIQKIDCASSADIWPAYFAGHSLGEYNALSSFVDVTIRYEDGAQQVILNRENVSDLIRTEEVGSMASATSVYMPVREKLVELQQELARKTNVIMDGRDIGTCVLPDAPAKIYLTASVDVRAKRRYGELVEKGVECDLESIAEDIKERDHRDMNREHSPLKQAEDAVLLDSSLMTISQVADAIIAIAREHGLEV